MQTRSARLLDYAANLLPIIHTSFSNQGLLEEFLNEFSRQSDPIVLDPMKLLPAVGRQTHPSEWTNHRGSRRTRQVLRISRGAGWIPNVTPLSTNQSFSKPRKRGSGSRKSADSLDWIHTIYPIRRKNRLFHGSITHGSYSHLIVSRLVKGNIARKSRWKSVV